MGGSEALQQRPQPVSRRLFTTHESKRWVGVIECALGVGVAYYLAAHLSLFLLTKPDGVAVFWPAAGVSTGALIAMGRSARWPVAVGTIAATLVANLMGDRNIWSAIVFAVCNAGEAVLAASLIERYVGSDFRLSRLRDVLVLMAAAAVSAAVSGIGGTTGFILFHSPSSEVLTAWLHWFMSDAVGIITVAPLITGLASALPDPPSRGEIVHGAAALAAVTAMSVILILQPLAPWKPVFPIALLFPLLVWPAARCRPVFSSASSFLITISIVWAMTFGLGYFGDVGLSIDARILIAQATILGVVFCSLVLTALFAERREHAALIEDREARLQEALVAAGATTFDWDVRAGLTQRDGNAAQALGLDRQQADGRSAFLARVHPDDRALFEASVLGLDPNSPSYAVTFRFMRPDGQELWLEEVGRAEFDDAGSLKRLRGLTVDVTAWKAAEEHQSVLMAELDHRVKNVLARVSAVATSTRQGSNSMDEFVRTLDGRIQSMVSAHSLLSESHWQGVGLRQLVLNQLAPYANSAGMSIRGADVELSPAATQAVAMVLHELVTNAAKYGALSTPGARLSVSWNLQAKENVATSLIIEWQELGGPPISVDSIRSGFGTDLIRQLIPHELGGTVDLTLAPDGAQCRIIIPLER